VNLIDLFSKAITERRCLVTVVFLPFFLLSHSLTLAYLFLQARSLVFHRRRAIFSFIASAVMLPSLIMHYSFPFLLHLSLLCSGSALWEKASPAHRTIQEEEEEKRNQGCLLSRVASAHRTHVHRAVVNYRIALRRAPAKGAIGAV
jgi:hypothetical protein